ncbi:MAG TPA: AbrB/MazE/SpoVT family DNA-binding domain-containing protein [Dehalococcoidia bacterium]|nr:AbrB/MazE/SpoVT family DNA-binding domain-containing protein [Dehalococcoidia bacterium]
MVSQLKPKRRRREPVVSVARITSKGQITVPKAVRDHFGLKTGDEIAFVEDSAGVRIRKKRKSDAFRKWHGFLKDLKGSEIDQMIDEMRGR